MRPSPISAQSEQATLQEEPDEQPAKWSEP